MTLSWKITGVDDATIQIAGGSLVHESALLEGSVDSGAIDATTTFTLTATHDDQSAAKQITVEAAPPIGEAEPNDDVAHATALSAGGSMGAIDPGTDVDIFSIQVPEGSGIRAETSDGQGSCNFDSVLALLGADGTELGFVDEGGAENCSLIDPTYDSFAESLPAGTYYLKVSAYDSTMPAGAYSLSVAIIPPPVVAAMISAPGGTAAVSLAGHASSALVQITLTTPGQAIEVSTEDQGGGCLVDTMLSLSKDDELMGFAFDSNTSSCAAIIFPQDSFATDLASGNYLLEITDEGDVGGTTMVTVSIHDPACGDGVKQTLAGEQCDDGNTTASDGCSATCTAESRGTVMGPGPAQDFTGALPIGGEAIFTIIMSEEGYIGAETYLPALGSCDGTAPDTQLDLLDSTFTVLGVDSDDGVELCSKIEPATDMFAHVQAGTYYLRVWQWDGMIATPEYHVQIKTTALGCGNGVLESGEQCDDGNTTASDGCSASCVFEGSVVQEMEPNDASTSATSLPVTIGSATTVHAAIDPVGDADWYSFQIAAGAPARITAKTYSALGNPNGCINSETDTKLFLLSANAMELTNNDDANGFYCSTIDGSMDPMAASLAAGTYYLRVEHYANSQTIPSYFLDLTVER